MESVFRCSGQGLDGVLRGGLLGGYDGAGKWNLVLPNIRGGSEQLLVETHEGLHHELQATSGFGLVAAMSLLLSDRGLRSNSLRELFHAMVESSRLTHEVFATFVSSSVVGVDVSRRLLAGNDEYLGHLERGLALVAEPGLATGFRATATTAVLRCCMAPRSVVDLLEIGYRGMTSRDLDHCQVPDDLLGTYEAVGGPASWTAMVDELEAQHPRGRFRAGPADDTDDVHQSALQLPDDSREQAARRAFEEDVVLRRCYEHVSAVLTGAGFSTVAWEALPQVAHRLTETVAVVDEQLASRLKVVTERRPILDDGLEFDRQGVVLRDPWPADVIDLSSAGVALGSFRSHDADGDPYVCMVWLQREVVEKQFVLSDGVELPDLVVAALAHATDATDAGRELVVLGVLPSSTPPRECRDILGDLPLLVVTSHLTLTDDRTRQMLDEVEPVFVVMDLPVVWHVEDWIRQGARVRMALLPLEGFGDHELLLATFTVDLAGNYRFLSIGAKTGVSIMVERLRQRHGEAIEITSEFVRADVGAYNLVIDQVLAGWHVLDQDAVR